MVIPVLRFPRASYPVIPCFKAPESLLCLPITVKRLPRASRASQSPVSLLVFASQDRKRVNVVNARSWAQGGRKGEG